MRANTSALGATRRGTFLRTKRVMSVSTPNFIKAYLANCSTDTRSQLLFTTHDVLLMDQQLLRRDEMWVAERNVAGASNLFSFSEYKDVRYDKDIRKSYLQGRLGGVPRILLDGARQCSLDGSEGKD